MDLASIYYLGVTFAMLIVFAVIVARTYNRKQRDKNEAPKYRMMSDD
jgi:positive regulator of sigma E activity